MEKYRMRLLSIVLKDTNISFAPSWNEKLLTRNIGKTRCSVFMTNECWKKGNKNSSLILQKAWSWDPSYFVFVWNPSIIISKETTVTLKKFGRTQIGLLSDWTHISEWQNLPIRLPVNLPLIEPPIPFAHPERGWLCHQLIWSHQRQFWISRSEIS